LGFDGLLYPDQTAVIQAQQPEYHSQNKNRQMELMLDDLPAGFIDPYTPAQ
jgi:hypothetical protein